jgi:glycosyltransferase involved in cell wall biosynthesis
MKVSVTVTCKGRRSQLQKTIPQHIEHAPDFPWEIIVVDYGCPGKAFEWVQELNHPNIWTVRVKTDVKYFNLSRARNIGAVHAGGDFLAFCDADVYPKGPWLQTVVEAVDKPGVAMCRPKWKRGGCGICCLPSSTYHRIRGHDESLEGWGWEDIDLKGRAQQVGELAFYDAKLLGIIKHNRKSSVQHYKDQRVRKGMPVTNGINKKKSKARKGLPNVNGYGLGEFDVWKPSQ